MHNTYFQINIEYCVWKRNNSMPKRWNRIHTSNAWIFEKNAFGLEEGQGKKHFLQYYFVHKHGLHQCNRKKVAQMLKKSLFKTVPAYHLTDLWVFYKIFPEDYEVYSWSFFLFSSSTLCIRNPMFMRWDN